MLKLSCANRDGAQFENPECLDLSRRNGPQLALGSGMHSCAGGLLVKTLAGRAGAAGVATTLQIWPDMIHAFPMFFPRVAASRQATLEAGSFIRRHFAD